jgi:hypothetical protein
MINESLNLKKVLKFKFLFYKTYAYFFNLLGFLSFTMVKIGSPRTRASIFHNNNEDGFEKEQ